MTLQRDARKKTVRELLDLTGRVAIVTGGSTGLGRQMAEALAEMGANLVLARERKNAVSKPPKRCRNLASRPSR